MKKIYIYLLRCPVTKLVRYVGSTATPKPRFKAHLKDAQKNRTEKQKWILSLQAKGDLPIMEIVTFTVSEVKRRQVEEEQMLKYIDSVYNIHMPDKGHGYVAHFRETGIKEKGNQPKNEK